MREWLWFPFASRTVLVRIRLRGLAALPIALLFACSGGSSEPGEPPGASSTDPPPDPPSPVATSLVISPDSAQLEALGATIQFTAEVRDRDGNAMTGATITWSSDAPDVATVDATGLVTAVGTGTAAITAMSGELSAAAAVTVEMPPAPPRVATSLRISPASAELDAVGKTIQFTVEVRDQNGDVMTDVAVAWTSDTPAVATVDATGLVTAVGTGMAAITAMSGELSAAAAVTVEMPPAPPRVATSLRISPASAELDAVGKTIQFTVEVRDQNGDVMTDVAVAWTSDTPAVATVDGAGLVTAVGAGAASIAAAAGGLSVSGTVTVEAATENASDREALVALYESMGGERWVNSANWLSDLPLDDWHGIGADRDGNVLDINLSNNGLEGEIPPQIGQLTSLEYLHLGINSLSGGIPPELGNLSSLAVLSLDENELSGPIRREIAQLAELNFLSLTHNRLSGPIPPELATLPNLQYLSLFANNLSGPIPPELGNFVKLQALEVNRNRLTGPIPPELGRLTTLTDLNIANNDLQGVFPVELTKLPLLNLWWAGNPDLCMPLTAAYTTWLGAMKYTDTVDYCNRSDQAALDALYEAADGPGWTNADGWPDDPPDSRHGIRTDSNGRVTAIDLSDNGLAGELPLALGDLTLLRELRLGGNPELSGRLPYSLSRLQALSELRYAATALCVPPEDFLREWLGGLPVHEGTGENCEPSTDREVLTRLYETLGGSLWRETANWLTDAPLREWHGVDTDGQGRVTRLDLAHNGLSGYIPADIVALEELTELRLIGIDTRQAPIPPELGELANLTILSLAGIRAAGPFPPQLGKLDRLRILNLSDNELSGPIPPELGNLAELVELHLDNNRLAGPIPHQLGNAAELEQIHIANNELSGTLPTSLAGLERLWILDLSGNRLSDYLPTALGDFKRLQYLNLSYNALFGAIPAELGNLGSLTDLYLGGNALSGPVPPELGGLSRLRSLALTGNTEMAGPLPESLAGLHEMDHLQATGTELCAPEDAVLLAWLDRLLTRRVAPCGFEPAAAYLTQAIQSRDLPIALVAGEEALLRVFPTAARANAERMPAVRADFYLGGSLAHSLRIDSRPGPIPTELDESSLDRSVNAPVPAEVVQPGLEMAFEIDPDGTLDEGLGVTRQIPESGRLAVEVRSMPRFDITFVPFVWETNPDTSVVDLVNAMEADPEGHEMLSLVRTLLPVGDIAVTAHAPVQTSTNAAHELMEQTRLIATMEGATGYYMGLLAGEVIGAAGIASLGEGIAFSITDASVIAHEIGHNLSLQHTPCGNPLGLEPAYPYANASPGGWGYDFGEQRLVSPDEYVDLMSYCSPYWVSDFSFDKALRYRLHGDGRLHQPATSVAVESVSSLLVWGGVDAGSRPFLEPALVVEAPPALPRAPGPYRISGEAADGTVLFDFSFDMPVAADGDGRSGFAFALPVQPGWPGALASITLSGPHGSFTLDGDEDAVQPVTVLRDGPTGQVTGIVREPAAADALRTLTGPGLHSRGIPESADWSR